MAELVNAFKSKYTGEQMEGLLDKINELSEVDKDSTFNTLYPYTHSASIFETEDVKITSTVTNLNLTQIIIMKTKSSSSWKNDQNITFLFKKGNIIPSTLYIDLDNWQTGTSVCETLTVYIDYYINNQWVTKVQQTYGYTYNTVITFNLPKEETNQIRMRCIRADNPSGSSQVSVTLKNIYVEYKNA